MEIILAILAAVGVISLLIRLFTYCFYRRRQYPVSLLADLRGMTREEAIELFETISTVTHTPAGRALVDHVLVRLDPAGAVAPEEAGLYMRLFELPGKILLDEG